MSAEYYPIDEPSTRFRCPKCGLVEWPGDGNQARFDLLHEADHDRLRVECRRCHYVGYEDCADAIKAPPIEAPVLKAPSAEEMAALTRSFYEQHAGLPRPWYRRWF